MAWRVTWQVRCEKCGKLGPRHRESDKAEARAVKAGWLKGHCYGMSLHLCPECVAHGLPDWWPDATGLLGGQE